MAKQEVELATIKNVHFYYSNLAHTVLTKNAKDAGKVYDENDPKANSEWVVKIAVPRQIFLKMKEKWNAKNFPNAKEYTLAKFEEVFHSDDDGKPDGTMPDFGDKVTEVAVIKFSQKARSKAGKDMNPPALIGIKGKTHDNNGVEVTPDTLIGNGSVGHIQVRPVDFGTKHGLYLYPNAVCITELVVYEPEAGAGVDYDAFGIEDAVEEEEVDDEFGDDFDDDIPF